MRWRMDSTSSSAWSQATRKSSQRCLKASSAASVAAVFSPLPEAARASSTAAAAATNSSYAALSSSTVASISPPQVPTLSAEPDPPI
uniref:Uncharacterized protein n=1 Tax=Arundo donax TaxID=35708 RepID=A0A0A9DXN7_ARUDO